MKQISFSDNFKEIKLLKNIKKNIHKIYKCFVEIKYFLCNNM